MKTLLLAPIIESATKILRSRGLDVDVVERLDRAALCEAVKKYPAIISMLSYKFDADVFRAAEGGPLKIVANYAVGYDNIDLAAAAAAGIWVTNTPDVLTNATAEMAWALVFAAARRLIEGDALARSGTWKGWGPTQLVGREISGKTVGIVGAGRIGQAFARMGQGFGIKVLYFSRQHKEDFENARRVDLDTLCAESDIISIHLPKTDETAGMISARRIALMKTSAILVNTGRGTVVDEAALADALEEGLIAAAGLDVYEREPVIHPKLLTLSNVVLAPHLGSATQESRNGMANRCADNIVSVFEGKRPPDAL